MFNKVSYIYLVCYSLEWDRERESEREREKEEKREF